MNYLSPFIGLALTGTVLTAATAAWAQTGPNPYLPFYGSGGVITSTPSYPIVGENAHITVTVGNNGTEDATNVRVKISYNDWGVTFNGWQEISTVVIPSIPAGGSATAEVDHVFQNRAHTCLEAVIEDALANIDPNDDRGQINLEVIHAGETFSYWVPIVNNGDAALDLWVVGRCKGVDGAADQGVFRCKEDAQAVHVEPGAEVLVPIELDLRGVPAGHEVRFIVDAYDLGAQDPFAPANHNHVEFRILRHTARHLETKALLALETLQVPGPDLQNRIDEVIKHVRAALKLAAWVDDNQLQNSGAQVFAQNQAALNQIGQLLATDLKPTVKSNLNEVALQLTDTARILAETANRAAGGIANAAIESGDDQRAAGDYPAAVDLYKQAWQAARP